MPNCEREFPTISKKTNNNNSEYELASNAKAKSLAFQSEFRNQTI